MEDFKLKDRIRGSLIGGAIGDVLGYPIEFINSYSTIQRKYGRQGLTRFDTNHWWLDDCDSTFGEAIISDDTQMTLFTACGILNSSGDVTRLTSCIKEAYIEWLFTQIGRQDDNFKQCWIQNLPEMNVRRAPGHTCITALEDLLRGTEPCNNSKGCGGVMRIAPIPLYGAAQNRWTDVEAIDRLAADAAKLTHQHPLGYISAALLAHIIYLLTTDEEPDKEKCKEYIREGLEAVQHLFTDCADEMELLVHLIKKAMLLSDISTNDVQTIEEELGGGWVAEETVAIAIYCVLAYWGNFERAIIAAVNHAGDSDSTGAVTGNLLGAIVEYDAIPSFYKEELELHDVILHIADDLYKGETTLCQVEKFDI